jgi:hypothetical protein
LVPRAAGQITARYSCRPRQQSNRPKRSSVRSIMVHAVPTSVWRIHIDGIVECRPLANSDPLGCRIGRPDEHRDNAASITTPYGHKSCCRAIKTRATKRSIAFLLAEAGPFNTWDSLSTGRALSMEASAWLSFGTTGTRPWPRWKRLPPSSFLSWWVLALSCWCKVGGDKPVRQKIDLARRRQTGRLDQKRVR